LARAFSDFFAHLDREQRRTADHELGVIKELERQRLLREQLQERRRVRTGSTAEGSDAPLVGASGVALLRQIIAAQAADNTLLSSPLDRSTRPSQAGQPNEIEE
jgi:hypothetical protein